MSWQIEHLKIPHSHWEIESLVVPDSGIWGLVGHNGAGKSQVFSRLVSWSIHSKAARFGLVAQNPLLQLTEATVWDQVTWPFRRGRTTLPRETYNRVSQILEDWDLLDLRQQEPWQLSGGQQRCLALAAMECLAPDVYLLDEPLENLDHAHQRVLESKIRKWGQTAAVIITSHSWQWLLTIAAAGWWCHEGLIPGDLGDLWYRFAGRPETPLEDLWRRLLDANMSVTPRAWTDPAWARQEAVKIWDRGIIRQSIL